VILDPWLDHVPLQLLDDAGVAARLDETGASILIVESDFLGPLTMERPLVVVGATRGDPTNVPVAEATAAGIPVLHTPGRNADAVAEMAVALLFAVTRHMVPADRDARARQMFRDQKIAYQHYRAWQVAGSTIGVVGFGAVGRAAAWRFAGLGATVITSDPFATDATHGLDDLLAEADVVSMHAAVTPDSFGLMNEARFAQMKSGSVYLNTARAGLHDLDALTEALRSGHLAGAGLDHFDGERLPKGHPIIDLEQVVLTPHIGGATYDTEIRQTEMIVADVLAVLDGRAPVHCVNREVLK